MPLYTAPITHDAIKLMEQSIVACVDEEDLETIPDAETLIPCMETLTFESNTILPDFKFTPPDAEYAHEPQLTSMEETGVPVYQQWQYDSEDSVDYGLVCPEQNKTSDKTVSDWLK